MVAYRSINVLIIMTWYMQLVCVHNTNMCHLHVPTWRSLVVASLCATQSQAAQDNHARQSTAGAPSTLTDERQTTEHLLLCVEAT